MKDARPTGKLVLKKTDAEDSSPLAGAEFELRIKKSGKLWQPLSQMKRALPQAETSQSRLIKMEDEKRNRVYPG